MPIYEYRCQDCGEHYEKRQRVTDEPLKVCEKCSGRLEKQWSRTGFQFKGEGWYVTDYAAKKPAEKSSSESTGKSDSASNKQSDMPAAAKTDSGTKSD